MMAQIEAEGIQEVGDYHSNKELEIDKDKNSDAVMVVRAHGISPDRRKYLKSLGLEFRDATCPDVGIIAGKIRTHARKGYSTIIFGDPKHPEVVGLMGYSMDRGYVIKKLSEVDELPDIDGPICLVSQSTMFTDEFIKLGELLSERFPQIEVFDTIRGATKDRQSDVVKIVEEGAEAVVVIGGHHSSNTKKLALLVEKQNVPAFHIETAADLDFKSLENYEVIGVSAGASTLNS